jgi:histidinol-phosphate aminotransferase
MMQQKIDTLTSSRSTLLSALAPLQAAGHLGQVIGSNEANFVVVPVLGKEGNKKGKPDNKRANAVYKELAEQRGVVVRYRGGEMGCEGCLRITVGSEEEIQTLVKRLTEVLEEL